MNEKLKRCAWHCAKVPLLYALLLLMQCALGVFVFFYYGPAGGAFATEYYWRGQVDWFIALNAWSGDYPIFWHIVTDAGNAAVLVACMALMFLARYPSMYAALLASLPFLLLLYFGKEFFAVPRPAKALESDSFFIVGEPLASYTSLPSGHTMAFFVVVGIVLFTLCRTPNSKNLLYWALGLLIASFFSLSRVFVGAHWPLDLVFGALCGLIASAGGVLLAHHYRGWWSWFTQPKYAPLCITLCVLASILLALRIGEFALLNPFVTWGAAGIYAFLCLLLMRWYWHSFHFLRHK